MRVRHSSWTQHCDAPRSSQGRHCAATRQPTADDAAHNTVHSRKHLGHHDPRRRLEHRALLRAVPWRKRAGEGSCGQNEGAVNRPGMFASTLTDEIYTAETVPKAASLANARGDPCPSQRATAAQHARQRHGHLHRCSRGQPEEGGEEGSLRSTPGWVRGHARQ